MSADGWRATVAASRAQAEAIAAADPFADLDDPPTLTSDEPDPERPDDWLIHAYFDGPPEADWLARLAACGRGAPVVERLPDRDWVTLSQAGLTPVRAGRIFVATPAHIGERRPGDIALVIDAGLAFGTGQHATTAGCLTALGRLARARRFRNVLDLGTGTGVLAFAAARLWSGARVTATDIDAQAVGVARDNARANAVRLGGGRGRVDLFAAAGMAERRLRRRGGYDLIVANILARPLIDLAGPVARALAPGGVLILAGLLDGQATAVSAAYAARKLRRVATSGGTWPTLVLRR